MSTFRLAHLSDLHLAPPPWRANWRDLASKRLLSRLAWRRKRHNHSAEALAAIAADVRAQAPDHIALTGDLTNFSTAEEFAAARRWLETLGPVSTVTVSPGNHDALVRGQAADPFAAWRPWLGDKPDAPFPTIRIRGPVALINLCSALPTAPHLAQGRLGEAQLGRLADLLQSCRGAGLFRILLIHHPVTSGVVSARKALTDGPALRETLARYGAELVLHGHAHEAALSRVKGSEGPIPVLSVPSASAPPGGHGVPARWHGFEVERRNGGGFATRVVVRGFAGGLGVEELGRYVLSRA